MTSSTNTHELGALRQSPEAGTESVTQLVLSARSGRIRIPEFQRGLRWQSKDVIDLFDSIYRGLPIGSLLFWRKQAPASVFHLGPLRIDAPETPEAWWVVDGQQRVTSLAAALARDIELPREPTDPYVVYFDAANAVFVTAKSAGPLRPELVPLPALLDAAILSEWVHNWPLSRDMEARRRVFEAGTRIRDYKVPRYLVDAADDPSGLALLREIFYRINKKGKGLEWEEVHDALYGESTSAPTRIGELADELAKLGMGRPSGTALTTALLALRGLDVTRPLSEHRDKDPGILHGAVAEAVPALKRSLSFLRARAEIPHLRLLPRTLVLDVLTRFFSLHPKPRARSNELLVRWTWRVLVGAHALDERTLERRTIAAINQDEEQSLQRMLELVPAKLVKVPPMPEAFDARAADSRLAAIAIASFGPREIATGEPIDVGEFLEIRGKDAFAPILLRSGDDGRRGPQNRIFSRAPAIRHSLKELINSKKVDVDEILWSHAIGPKAAKALASGQFQRFLRIRQKTIAKRLAQLVERRTGSARGDHDRPSIQHLLSE